MAWGDILLTTPTTSIPIDNFSITRDEVVFDVEADRPPYSEVYYLTGTKAEIGRLSLSVRPKLIDGYAAQEQLGLLLDNINEIQQVNWNSKFRQTWGPEGAISVTPTEKFFNVAFTLPCRTDWTIGAGDVIDPYTCLPVVLPIPPLEPVAFSFPGALPVEQFDYSRRIEISSIGPRQRGDLKRNPSSLTLPLTINTGNANDTWATAFHIGLLARNLKAIVVNNAEREVLHIRRINREYRGCAINLTLEFFMKERVYPHGQQYLLYENLDFVQFENNDLAIVG